MQIIQFTAALRRVLTSLAALLAVSLACQAGANPTASEALPATPRPPAAIVAYTTPHPSPSPTPQPSATITPTPQTVSLERLAEYVQALAAIHSRHVNNPGIQQAADYIVETLRGYGGNLQIGDDRFTLSYDGVVSQQRNIIARLPGSDPDAGTILVGAHYDSRAASIRDAQSPAPGANDNASGVAVILELARLLAITKPRPTLLLVAFSAEEEDAQGSRHLAQTLADEGVDLRAAIILDIVGNGAGEAGGQAIRIFSAPPGDSPSRQLALRIAELANQGDYGLEALVQDTLDRPGRYSDHVPFSQAGFPSVRLIESIETPARQHNALDLPEAIDYEYVAKVTRMLVGVLNNLAVE